MSLLKRLGGAPQEPPANQPLPSSPPAPPEESRQALTHLAPPPPPPAETPMPAAPGMGGLSALAPQPQGVVSSPPTDMQQKMLELSLWIVDRIQSTLGSQTQIERNAETERMMQERFAAFYRQSGMNFSQEQIHQLYQMVLDEMFGFGPLEALIRDENVTEIMVNGPKKIYIELKGKTQLSPIQFANDDHVLKIIDRIIRPLGRRIDRKWPMVDARLPDGSRVNAIIPPCAIDGPSISIRKFSKHKLTVDDLIRFGSMTKEMAEFLRACVVSALNIVVSGGTGSGKTTLLNVLSNFIPEHDRIVTIEDSAELQLGQDHVVRLEAKPPEVDGTGRVTIRDLVINSLRMRPDRIVVGECRGGEALDMLQAMNTGHDGSMTTVHANSPRDTIRRLETLALMSGMDLPVTVIREQIASAVDLIVQQARLRDGSRKVINITEVQGMESGQVVLQDIFMFEDQGTTPDGKVIGQLKPTGTRPKFTPKLEANGFKLPPSIFGAVFPGGRR
ncbi:MAG: type II secretion system protein E [Herpetosiphonaceae bacterium]|nr:MAG: type II secretion system protein E [Herpetosiphonaceae bacterium]